MGEFGGHRTSAWQAAGCGFARHDLSPGHELVLKNLCHDDIVFLAFEGSAWTASQNRRTFDETPGCLVLRDAGQVYSTRMDHARPGAVCREIHISPARLEALYAACENALPPIDFHTPLLARRDVAARLMETHTELEQGLADPGAALLALVAAVATASSGRLLKVSSAPCSRRSRMVIDILRSRCEDKITLADLADTVDANPFVLLRQFRRETGVTPHEYLTAVRLCRARRLIRQGTPLAEVAVACGFADQSHLTRQFKRSLGVPPSRFQ